MTTHRQTARFGWVPDLPDPRDHLYHLDEKILRGHQLPLKFSLRDKMPQVFDQGQLGSCTANAIVGALMAIGMKQGEAELALSRLFIYYNEREIEGTVNEDAGAMIRDGIKSVASQGAPPETDWPYDIARFAERPPQNAYATASKHEALAYQRVLPLGYGAPIRTALHRGLPIVGGFPVPDYFEGGWDPKNEALPLPDQNTAWIGGHAVVAIGWDFTREHFPVRVVEWRNSWRESWGDRGCFWTDADWLKPGASLFEDLWAISRVS